MVDSSGALMSATMLGISVVDYEAFIDQSFSEQSPMALRRDNATGCELSINGTTVHAISR